MLDLFSGIGGFALGLERAGMRTVAFCEVDEFCRRVLAKHWPGMPIYGDIRELSGERLAADGIAADLVCGGFPCQPWSLAGSMRGHDDDRDLWPEMLRVIRDVRPRWVVGENVPGLDDKRFMALDRVLADLEGEGYQGRPFEIPACAVDAPHKRSRLFIVANRERGGCGGQQAGAGWNEPDGQAARWQQDACRPEHGGAGAVTNGAGEGLSQRLGVGGDAGAQFQAAQRDCAVVHGAGHGWGEGWAGDEVRRGWAAVAGAGGADGALEHPNGFVACREWEQRGGQFLRAGGDPQSHFGEYEWLVDPAGKARRVKPGVRLLAHGIPGRTHQIRALGNSVVPQVVEVIGRAILAAERMCVG